MFYSHNHICGDVYFGGVEKWRFMGIYGWPIAANKWRTWDLLRSMVGSSNISIVIGGDFNVILRTDEKERGVEYGSKNITSSRDVVNDLALMDLGFARPKFT